MKLKLFNLTTFMLISLLFFTVASCQQNKIEVKESNKTENNEISEKDFNEILATAKNNLEGKIYRLTETEEFYREKTLEAPERTEIYLLEIVPPDKRREIKEIKSPTENSKTERIWDGKNLFVKKNDGKWEKFSGGNSFQDSITSGRTSKVYNFLGMTELNGQKTKLFSEETKRIANKFTQTSRYQVHYYENTNYWISENGFLLKIERVNGVEKIVTDEGIKTPESLTKKISVYEYDPTIKIEAPIK